MAAPPPCASQPATYRQETGECHHYVRGQGHRELSTPAAFDPLPVEVKEDKEN